MGRWLVICLSAAALVAGGGLGAGWTISALEARGAAAAARMFIVALATGDMARAEALAGPRLAVQLASRREALVRAGPVRVVETEIDVTAAGGGWAWASARVETQGMDWDVLWYDLVLVRRNGAWRVAEARPALPRLEGPGRHPPRDFNFGAFNRYLDAVQKGAWEEAARSLAGPALLAHRAGRAALGPSGAGLFRAHTSPTVVPLWSDGDRLVVARAQYQLDGREVSVLVTLFRTAGGAWRVVEVSQE